VPDELAFRPDLYRGAASHYDQFRVGYPTAMVDDLVARSGLTGRGRLLDLACGTGQATFAAQDRFSEVWAVDQETDMVELVRTKAATAGMSHIRAVVSTAEDFAAPVESFELVAIGNAFHRLQQPTVAGKVFRWLEPGRCLALLWANSPWHGAAAWQKAMAATLDTWMARTGAQQRIPDGWERVRREHPDGTILERSGFERRAPTPSPATMSGRLRR
jgi:ubiquinone/menaquinone biosynthesis C-methylase UbiE